MVKQPFNSETGEQKFYGMDISGITQQDLPVLPLDFVTHVYKSARILLHVFQLLSHKFASQGQDKYIILTCHFHF
jgi:hypothetical protein